MIEVGLQNKRYSVEATRGDEKDDIPKSQQSSSVEYDRSCLSMIDDHSVSSRRAKDCRGAEEDKRKLTPNMMRT